MGLGDLVISLSMNTATLQSDTGKAGQLLDRLGSKIIATSKQAEAAIKQLSDAGVTSVDRLQKSFNTLGIKSGLNIDAEKSAMLAAFNQIKNSGVASADEIKRAHAAMQSQLNKLDGKEPTAKVTAGLNLFSLASVAAIAKAQVLYTVINQVASAMSAIPGTVVDSIESFNMSVIKNAATITSMQTGVTDLGKAYQQNKTYAEAVQNVLLRMDASTIASYRQLQLMNDAFVQQGVFIDINNKKQLEGFQNIANALATISAGSPNVDLQFTQEIKGLLNEEDKAGNMLFRQLEAIDPKLKQHLEEWKKIASETGNAGYLIEKIGPLLDGYAAASGDINGLWTTIKSTMATLRDEVLRGGLSDGFKEIVKWMGELNKSAVDNKDKIQQFLKDNFARLKPLAQDFWEMTKAVISLGAALAPVLNLMSKLATFVTRDVTQGITKIISPIASITKSVVGLVSHPITSLKQFAGISTPTAAKAADGNATSVSVEPPKPPPAKVDEKLLAQIKEKELALSQAYSERIIAAEKDAAQARVEILKDQYNAGLISTKVYLDKKLSMELDANQKEINAANKQVAALQGQVAASGEDKVKQLEAQTKLEKQLESRDKLVSQRGKIQQAATEEAAASDRKSFQEMSSHSAKILELSGDTVGAEQQKQEAYHKSVEFLRLQLDAENNANAAKTLGAIKLEEMVAVQQKQTEYSNKIIDYDTKLLETQDAIAAANGKDSEYLSAKSALYQANVNKTKMIADLKRTELTGDIAQHKYLTQAIALTTTRIGQLQQEVELKKRIADLSAADNADQIILNDYLAKGMTDAADALRQQMDLRKLTAKIAQDQAKFDKEMAQAVADGNTELQDKLTLAKQITDEANKQAQIEIESYKRSGSKTNSGYSNNSSFGFMYSVSDLASKFSLSLDAPSLDVGTNFFPEDGYAYLHKGEAVVPREYNPAAGGSGGSGVNVHGGITVSLPNVKSADDYEAIANGVLAKLKVKNGRFL